MTTASKLPETGFLTLNQIIGQKSGGKYKRKSRADIPALIPVSRTTFLNRVKSGEYPAAIKLGERSVVWKVQDIRALIAKLGGAV